MLRVDPRHNPFRVSSVMEELIQFFKNLGEEIDDSQVTLPLVLPARFQDLNFFFFFFFFLIFWKIRPLIFGKIRPQHAARI